VPSNATIAAPSALYALAATHREMIVLEKAPSPQDDLLPFNYSGWPEFVLLYSEISPSLSSVKAWGNFSNGSMYGMRAYVASTGIGSIFLYEQRFSLPAQPFGPALPSTAENWTPTRGLLAGTIAREYANSSSPSGSILETNLSLHRGGLAWTASVPVLAPGNYSFTAAIAVTGVNGTLPASKPVFEVVAGGFGRTLYDQNFTLDQLQGSPWAMVTWNSTLLSPLPGFEVQGILRSSDCSVAVAQLEAQVLGPP